MPTLNGLYGSKARLTAAAIAADRKRSAMDTIVQTLAPQHSDIIVMGSGFLGCRATKGSTGGTPVVKVGRRGGCAQAQALELVTAVGVFPGFAAHIQVTSAPRFPLSPVPCCLCAPEQPWRTSSFIQIIVRRATVEH